MPSSTPVLLHLDPAEPSRLLGLWSVVTSDGGPELAAYYPACAPGVIAQAALTLQEKVPDIPWSTYFRQLADRIPSSIWWETTEVEAGSPLPDLFLSLAADVLASAAALHGISGGSPSDELRFTACSPRTSWCCSGCGRGPL